MNRKLGYILISILLFIMPVIMIFAFTNKPLDLEYLLYSLEKIDIVEQVNEIKSVSLDFGEASGIIEKAEQFFQMVKLVIELLVVSPLKSIVDIINIILA